MSNPLTRDQLDAVKLELGAVIQEAATREATTRAAAQKAAREEAAGEAAKRLKRYRWEDGWILVCATLLACVGTWAMKSADVIAGWTAVGFVDVYLLSLVVLAGLRTDHKELRKNHPWVAMPFPRRTAGIFVIFLLLLASVTGFAALYLAYDVFPPDVFPQTKNWLDALYDSVLVLGFSDFKPYRGGGQKIVLAQLFSGIVLLIGAFPLLISRLSTFDSES